MGWIDLVFIQALVLFLFGTISLELGYRLAKLLIGLRPRRGLHRFRHRVWPLAVKIKDQFRPTGDPEPLEYPEEMVLDRVLTYSEEVGDFAVLHPFGNFGSDLVLPLGEQDLTLGIRNKRRKSVGKSAKNAPHLLTVSPDLPSAYAHDALAQLLI